MNIKNERLLSLIQFTQEAAKMRLRPRYDVAGHPFCVFEHKLQGMPGVHFNCGSEEEETWLVIDRLHKTTAPTVEDPQLLTWMEISNKPTKKPELRTSIELEQPLSMEHTSSYPDFPPVNEPILLWFEDCEDKLKIESRFETYLVDHWIPWANEEKKRRQTITLYSKLFTIKQQLEGSLADEQLELVWGLGMAVWSMNKVKVCHPLISQTVELKVNDATMALEISPRDIEDQLELEVFMSADNPGTVDLEKTYKAFVSSRTQILSPFDRGSFEGILRAAVKFLDSKGVYWPEQVSAGNRKLPSPSEELKVTDTWALILRPRSKSPIVQDLERFKTQLEAKVPPRLPNAVCAILTKPSDVIKPKILPAFRGISTSRGHELGTRASDEEAMELYFPLPFNTEQARIVQLLERYDGVIVQGPPGTGKTHTIANIIAHYLALGKRILVTSMKEPALAVLRDKLPVELQPLAISLLTNEPEGMKQFEYSIGKIASEIQNINPIALKQEINQLDKRINLLHSEIANIDRNISSWSKKNLDPISIDGDAINPIEAANEVVQGLDQFEWLEDTIPLDSETQFCSADLVQLRKARQLVGNDINYLGLELAEISSFPDIHQLLRLHQDLSRLAELEQSISTGDLPSLTNYSDETIHRADILIRQIRTYVALTQEIVRSEAQWKDQARGLLTNKDPALVPLIDILDTVGQELKLAVEERRRFLETPVSVPEDTELDSDVLKAIENLINGKSAFTLLGLLGKGVAKKKLQEIHVLHRAPESLEDWEHVHSYLLLRLRYRELLHRWNSIAPELSIADFESTDPIHVAKALEYLRLHTALREHISLESIIIDESQALIPCWIPPLASDNNEALFREPQNILGDHVLRFRFSNLRSERKRLHDTLLNYEGPAIDRLIDFISSTIGNPKVSDTEMQEGWSILLAELSHIHSLRTSLADITEICARIEHSGAPEWALKLRTKPAQHTVDLLLPDNWKAAWRHRKLATYLDQIDCRKELKALTGRRRKAETTLKLAYQDIVTKRTWLKLTERATPSIRSALQAFRTAISRIGKGTGIRSNRYRQDARQAAGRANSAIPCWIMPHWRISESLPPELGSFDLVIIDEASQSDLSALPALLRAQKVLVVGDDKQVSPDGVGLEEIKIRSLMARYLSNQIDDFRAQMTPERSIYDLFKVVFPESSLMLKEHFRCVGPIIEYSKREHYNHELKPIRLPKASERLDPPLVDILVEDGCRMPKSDVNLAEARFIVDEIRRICEDPNLQHRTIGVVSLLADKQALEVWQMLQEELGPELIKRHNIACGDARTFQGKERDIVFLSMVVSPGKAYAVTKDLIAQRFNVAASRAKDRMYLIRSIELEDLSPRDKLRRQLISHFALPYAQNEELVEDLREKCESGFEEEVYDFLVERGYRVIPQVKVGEYRIDMVVEGHNDTLLAIECDGDRYHGLDRFDADMDRQRTLERAGWHFWRCFASAFVKNRQEVTEELIAALRERGIEPIGKDTAPVSFHTEHRRVVAFQTSEPNGEDKELGQEQELTIFEIPPPVLQNPTPNETTETESVSKA